MRRENVTTENFDLKVINDDETEKNIYKFMAAREFVLSGDSVCRAANGAAGDVQSSFGESGHCSNL
jgi:hypothetical protein